MNFTKSPTSQLFDRSIHNQSNHGNLDFLWIDIDFMVSSEFYNHQDMTNFSISHRLPES